MTAILKDLSYAARSLRKSPLFTTIVVLTLALGIGANSTLFTIFNAVLLRPLPYPRADRLASLSEQNQGDDIGVLSSPRYFAWRQTTHAIQDMGAFGNASVAMTGTGDPEQVSGAVATASFFHVLGVLPARGRTFSDVEDRPNGPRVIVLSDQLWRRAFAADPDVLGRTLTLDGNAYSVIGVMPPRFEMPGTALYWIPFQLDPNPSNRGVHFMEVIGRLRDGVSLHDAYGELSARTAHADSSGPQAGSVRPAVVMTVHDRMFGDARPSLLLLFAGVGVLLLIACANVANLLLARAAARQKEFTIRAMLGAGRWQLVRQLLCESLLLSIIGGGLGLLIPVWTIGYVVRLSPVSVAHAGAIHVNGAVLAFTLVVSLATGLVFGLAPAIGATGGAARGALADAGGRTTASLAQHRLRRLLIVTELAMALVLLTTAGLLTKSFARLLSTDLGFRPDHVLITRIYLPSGRYTEVGRVAFYDQLMDRMRLLPGVQRVAGTGMLPLSGFMMSFTFTRPDGSMSPPLFMDYVSRDYFATVGMTVTAGRSFSGDDRPGGPLAAVVNKTMARILFAGEDPVGKTIPGGVLSPAPIVIGVVKDVTQGGVGTVAKPEVYYSQEQDGGAPSTVVARTTGDPVALEASVRKLVLSIDSLQPVRSFTTMDQIVSDSVAPKRFSFVLLAVLAVLAVVLAAIGLYGVMAYLVEQRTREIGIRVALGAEQRGVAWLVVRQAMTLALAGIAVGTASSLAAVRLLRGMVYDVSIYDPWTFAAVAALLGAVALLASYVPARRAARVDPMVALREE